MWAAAAAAYAAGCGGTSPVTICVQACWGSGKHCCWGSVSLPFPGPCLSQGQVIQLSWEPAVLCPGLFASHEFFLLQALAKV